MGWCSLLIASFKYLGSKQMCNWPSLSSLMTRLFSYSVGPVGSSIMPCLSISCISFFNLGSMDNATLCGVCILSLNLGSSSI